MAEIKVTANFSLLHMSLKLRVDSLPLSMYRGHSHLGWMVCTMVFTEWFT